MRLLTVAEFMAWGTALGAKYVLILCGVHPSSVMHGQAEAGVRMWSKGWWRRGHC